MDQIDQTMPHFDPEDGFLTKRSNAPTDRMFRSLKGSPKLERYVSAIKDNDDTVKDVSFERWARELKINDMSYMSDEKQLDENSNGFQFSVENLIKELKNEYKLNDSDVTQIKLDLDSTINIMSHSKVNYKGDKQIVKNNMMLNLMNQKVENIARKGILRLLQFFKKFLSFHNFEIYNFLKSFRLSEFTQIK